MRSRLMLTILALAVITMATLAPSASATQVSDAQLKAQLRHAQQRLRLAREGAREDGADLAAALALQAQLGGGLGLTAPVAVTPPLGLDTTLATRLLADGIVDDAEIAALRRRVSHAKRLARRWTVKVRNLTKRVHARRQIARWARQHNWRPLIEIAGRKYGVSPAGLYRMMMFESGGRPAVGTTYKGLFQYAPSTWARHWNPWHQESIFNGWAQIRATALALSKGMGPSQWPNTYPMAF